MFSSYRKHIMFSLPEKKQILKGLIQLRTSGPVIGAAGICGNLDELTCFIDDTAYGAVAHYAKAWPKALRNHNDQLFNWFVPEHTHFPMWEGPNLSLRNDLLDYLIEQVELDILNHMEE